MTTQTAERVALTSTWNPKLRGYPLFIETVAAITTFPDNHKQGAWACNSGCCAAGWAGAITGLRIQIRGERFLNSKGNDMGSIMIVASKRLAGTDAQAKKLGYCSARDMATVIRDGAWELPWALGHPVDSMFGASNTVEDITKIGAMVYRRNLPTVRTAIRKRLKVNDMTNAYLVERLL